MMIPMKLSGGRVVEADDPSEATIFVYTNPDESEKRYLVNELKMDEHTLNSALDPGELGRLEFEPEHVALIVKQPKRYAAEDNFLFKVLSLGLFLFKDRLIIVTADNISLFDARRIVRVTSLQDLVLKLLFASIFHFEDHLKVINMCQEDLEKKVNTAMENQQLFHMFTLEKSLVYYLNAIGSNGRLIEKIRLNSTRLTLSGESLELLDDVAIENAQCYEQAQIYSQVLSGLMDARASVVNNNLNLLMKSLTLFMIAIMVPTLWTSLFSMNVHIPVAPFKWAFWAIISGAVVQVAAVYVWQRYKRW